VPLDIPLQRSLYGSPLLNRNGKFALILGLVALFFYALPSFQRYYLTHPIAMLVGILAAFVLYFPTLLALYFFDRREREPGWLFWGTLVSVILYFGPVTSRTLGVFRQATALSEWQFVGFVEEFWKVAPLLLLLVFARPAVNGARDGLIYGALGGLGFAALESGAYFSLVYFPEEGWGGLWSNLLGRATLLGTDNHVLFSATLGAAIGYGVSSQNRWLRYLVPLGGYLLVVFTHAQQDYILGKALAMVGAVVGAMVIQAIAGLPSLEAIDGTPWQYLALIIGSTIGLVGINLINIPILFGSLWRSGDAERQVIRDQLASEPESVITPEEYAGVMAEQRLWLRSLHTYPPPIGRAIVQRQNELAFRKAYVQRQGGDVESDRPVAALRDAISQLRRESPTISSAQESIQ
jgi:RsiW-degrading membrane proteinase PrsW (M82 family)